MIGGKLRMRVHKEWARVHLTLLEVDNPQSSDRDISGAIGAVRKSILVRTYAYDLHPRGSARGREWCAVGMWTP